MNSRKYQDDFYAWTQEQAQLLRSHQWTKIDIANLIDEIESMGKSEKRALKSRLTILLMHLLKWQFQPNFRGTSWQLTLRTQRRAIKDLLADNPSLKHWLVDTLHDAYEQALDDASLETGLHHSIFPSECLWSIEQVLDLDYLPN